jgi:hypothetical protein
MCSPRSHTFGRGPVDFQRIPLSLGWPPLKMGKMQRDKGKRVELECVNLFKSWGLHSIRVPLSGATEYAKGDIDLYLTGRDAPLVGEVKARKSGFKQVTDALGENDFLVVRLDKREPIFILPVSTMKELLTRG